MKNSQKELARILRRKYAKTYSAQECRHIMLEVAVILTRDKNGNGTNKKWEEGKKEK